MLSAYGEDGATFKHRLLDFFFYPAFVLLGLYSFLIAIQWLAKSSIGLHIPTLSEINIAQIGDGVRRFFYIAYISIGSTLMLLMGYSTGVLGTLFLGRICL